MSDLDAWAPLIAGFLLALAGLADLAYVDFPIIAAGGPAALGASLELIIAAAAISAALGFATLVLKDPPK